MVAVRVVQVPVMQEVHMIAVRDYGVHGLTILMHMAVMLVVIDGIMAIRVLCRNQHDMLVHMIAMFVMHVTVMKIVCVTSMRDGHMAAIRLVLMVVGKMLPLSM